MTKKNASPITKLTNDVKKENSRNTNDKKKRTVGNVKSVKRKSADQNLRSSSTKTTSRTKIKTLDNFQTSRGLKIFFFYSLSQSSSLLRIKLLVLRLSPAVKLLNCPLVSLISKQYAFLQTHILRMLSTSSTLKWSVVRGILFLHFLQNWIFRSIFSSDEPWRKKKDEQKAIFF